MREKKGVFKLKNWWFGCHSYDGKGIWIVHGNCFGNPRFCAGQKMHTSRINKISPDEEGLLIETQNAVYSCKFDCCLEEDFNFLDDVELWGEELTEEEKGLLRSRIVFTQVEYRYKADKELSDEIQDEEYVLLVFADQKDYCFEDIVYKGGEKILHLGIYTDSPLATADDWAVREDIPNFDFRYSLFGNKIIFSSWRNAAKRVYAINKGANALFLDTPYGLFKIEANGKAYRLAPDVFAGRVADRKNEFFEG